MKAGHTFTIEPMISEGTIMYIHVNHVMYTCICIDVYIHVMYIYM